VSEHEATRTLVKSPPELWAVCSDAALLARHLGQFGEIRITRLDPETAVAWEGDNSSGTVRIEPAGWGTRVTLTAKVTAGGAPVAVVAPVAEPEPGPPVVAVAPPVVAVAPLVVQRKGGFFSKLRDAFGGRSVAPPPPVPVAAPVPEPVAVPVPEPVAAAVPERVAVVHAAAAEPVETVDHAAALDAALDSLGQAHHRPFSRG
jgi:hypothetical protein